MNRGAPLLVFALGMIAGLGVAFGQGTSPGSNDASVFRQIADCALTNGQVYTNLRHLCKNMPARISGNTDSRKAVEWTHRLMDSYGLDNVRLQPCIVPTWKRGKVARGKIIVPGAAERVVSICALGGSVPTSHAGITAAVIRVNNTEEIRKLPEGSARGKIIFINTRMDPTRISPFSGYLEAVSGRIHGAAEAARAGAVAVLVRSVTYEPDVWPHTGYANYTEGTQKIPAAAIASLHADWLECELERDPKTRFSLALDCQRLPDTESANVIAELRGSELPQEIVVLGAHLDCWDLGEGAHDDGGGCMQVIEALRILKGLGMQPRRTIRVVLFENEENGLRGSKAYGQEAANNSSREKHIFALETDCGAFAPVGFGFSGDEAKIQKIRAAQSLFRPYGLYSFESGGGGFDIQPLASQGVILAGLVQQGHRYFDYHHTARDVFESVNKRELEVGAANICMLAWWVSEHGL